VNKHDIVSMVVILRSDDYGVNINSHENDAGEQVGV